jgi:hypothetical protein
MEWLRRSILVAKGLFEAGAEAYLVGVARARIGLVLALECLDTAPGRRSTASTPPAS